MIAIVQTHTLPPAKYNTPSRLFARTCEPAMGAMIEKERPQKLANPHADPLTEAGNASGVQPYKTTLNIL